jgi:hypothetical protein
VLHSLVLTADSGFAAATEKALHAAWPGCRILVSHPAGDRTAIKALPRKSVILLDRRSEPGSESVKLLRKRMDEGDRLFEIRPVPTAANDPSRRPALGTDVVLHNLDWASERVAAAVAAAFEGRILDEAKPLVTLEYPKQKAETILAMAVALQQGGLLRTQREKISAVADELLMNALYSAPSKAKPHEMPRPIQMGWRIENKSCVLQVSDAWGTLARGTIEDRLIKFAGLETFEITRTRGRGGGVGLFLLLRHASSLRIRVVEDEVTDIRVRFDPTLSAGAQAGGRREILACFSKV